MFFRIVLVPDANLVGGNGNRISRCTVDLHILAPERPVPRSHDYGLCMRILQDDGRIIIDLRINLWLVVIDHRRNRLWRLAVHQPRGQVHAIAAKVVERAGAVLLRDR